MKTTKLRTLFACIAAALIALTVGAHDASSSFTPTPTGTGFRHVTSGKEDATSIAINLASAHVTGTLPAGNGGTGITSLGGGVATFLGTPSGANLASALTSALPDSKGGTGLTALGANVATFLGTATSANLAAAVSDETGSGLLVFGTSPVLTTPSMWNTGLTFRYIFGGSAIAANRAVTLPLLTGDDTFVFAAHSQTLTNKTISGASNTITNVSLTAGVTGTLPVGNGGTGITSLGTGVATFMGTPSSANFASAITDETGSGVVVMGTSPTITTPTLAGTVAHTGTSWTYTGEAKQTDTDSIPASLQTTDATVTNIFTFSSTTSHVYLVRCFVSNSTTNAAKYGYYSVEAVFDNNAGTLTQRAATPVSTIAESDASMDVTVDVSGTTGRVRVTGIAATNIRWRSRCLLHDGIF